MYDKNYFQKLNKTGNQKGYFLKQIGMPFMVHIPPNRSHQKKSHIHETKNLSTDADSRTDTIFERLRDLSPFFYFYFFLREVA